MTTHRVWISAKQIHAGNPGIIERLFDPDGQIVDTRWHERLDIPAGASVEVDRDAPKGKVAWIQWETTA